MKKFLAIILILIAALAAPAIIFFPSYEFFLWTSAGFDRDYRKINKCLDIEKGCWDYQAKVCRGGTANLDQPDVRGKADSVSAARDEANAQDLCKASRAR